MRKQRQIVVRIDQRMESDIENAEARYGLDISALTRCALRKYLEHITEADIKADYLEDQRRKYARDTMPKKRAEQALEELRHVTH